MTNLPGDDRISELEAALMELKAITACLPTEEQAERAIRTEDKVSRLLGFTAIPLIALVGLMVLAVVSVSQTRHAADANRAGVQCILTELAEHRATNHALNRSIAEKVGVAFEGAHRTLLPGSPSDEEIQKHCGRFHEHRVAGE